MKREKKKKKDKATPILGWALLLVVLIFIAYLPALHSGFIWDDDDAVTNNLLLRTMDGLWKIWTHPSVIPQGHYWPMVYTTFWMEYHLWGLSSFGYHFVNILLHIVKFL